jgi:hypothetical protein
MTDFNSSDFQRCASDFVSKHVLGNFSAFIEQAIASADSPHAQFDQDEIADWYAPSESALDEAIEQVFDASGDFILRQISADAWVWIDRRDFEPFDADAETIEEYCARERDYFDDLERFGDKFSAMRDALEVNHMDHEAREAAEQATEIFTWYAVSDFFARNLEAAGEKVIDFHGYRVWGRQTFGQLIASDYVVCEIVNEHEWEDYQARQQLLKDLERYQRTAKRSIFARYIPAIIRAMR